MVDETRDREEHASFAAASGIAGKVSDGKLLDFISYWQSIHPRDRLPGRQHFEPLDIHRLLPNVVLVDIEQRPFRIRFRVIGTRIVQAFNTDYTGKYADEVFPDAYEVGPFKARRIVTENSMPSYFKGLPKLKYDSDFAEIETVHLPLASDGSSVDMIVSMFIFKI